MGMVWVVNMESSMKVVYSLRRMIYRWLVVKIACQLRVGYSLECGTMIERAHHFHCQTTPYRKTGWRAQPRDPGWTVTPTTARPLTPILAKLTYVIF